MFLIVDLLSSLLNDSVYTIHCNTHTYNIFGIEMKCFGINNMLPIYYLKKNTNKVKELDWLRLPYLPATK
jgi:hypothetical protein